MSKLQAAGTFVPGYYRPDSTSGTKPPRKRPRTKDDDEDENDWATS